MYVSRGCSSDFLVGGVLTGIHSMRRIAKADLGACDESYKRMGCCRPGGLRLRRPSVSTGSSKCCSPELRPDNGRCFPKPHHERI